MVNILLSICIPTYNRAEILSKTLNHIIQSPNKEIEIIISDNASSDSTITSVKNINDPRIKYFRNNKNLGFDFNLLKAIEKANGKFVFLLSDEDYINLEVIDWILNIVRKNINISQILGKIGIIGNRYKTILYEYECKDQILGSGYNSLTKLFFQHGYLSGIILRKRTLNLNSAIKYVGSIYMHQILMAQAMVNGSTLCTSKIVCYQNYKSDINAKRDLNMTKKKTISKNRSPFNPLSRFIQMQYKRYLIYELLRDSPKSKKALIELEKVSAGKLLAITFYRSPYLFLKILPQVLRIREYSRSLTFWKNLPKIFIKNFKIRIIKDRWGLIFLLKELISPKLESVMIGPPWKNERNLHG